MKLTLEQITQGQEEIIIRYREMTDSLGGLIRSIEQRGEKIMAMTEEGKVLLAPSEVLYLESVDNCVYVYTENSVAKTSMTLAVAEEAFASEGFFRCSKSMVINIYRISYLRSISGNRADVTMDNGEHVIISRRYVKELRRILKGEQI
ncbi:MAG: LytTR family transcriptional regulator [Ruminococcaceae bacterium]|nr:LytTR family transcriptional regulator [Oscillospiraceae bacterium]